MSALSPIAQFLAEVLPSRQPHFRHNPVQVAYAASLSQGLATGPGQIHFIEGDTGIGKSLAYLLTLADWIARGRKAGRQGLVSTHSRALQRQLMSQENQAILCDYLEWQGLAPVTMGVRMGKSNYVCRERLARVLEVEDLAAAATDLSRPTVERQLARWALETEGCLLDLEPEDLPEGVPAQAIALQAGDPTPEWLAAHFDAVQAADIQIINHALLALDLATGQRITHTTAPVCLLLDEAEHFPSTAQEMLSRQLSFGVTRALLAQLGLQKAAETWRDLHARYRNEDEAGQAAVVEAETAPVLAEGLRTILKSRPRRARLDEAGLRHDWERLRADAVALLEAVAQSSSMLALSYSPVQGLPSLVLHQSAGGSILKSRMEQRVTLMTSATLSDLGHTPGEPPSFSFIRGELVMGANDGRLGLSRSHQALDFGVVAFRLPTTPVTPLVKTAEGLFELSPRYAAGAWVEIGAMEAGRTLVLCVSYADVESLLETCPSHVRDRVITHGRGAALTRLAEQMPEDGILLTPAGWEGLSPARTSDKAFWRHVVLLRNPTPRPDPVVALTMQRRFMTRHSAYEAHILAMRAVMSKGHVRGAHKLRQGIGRTIRHPDDEVIVTILDPRFPRPRGDAPAGVRVSPRLLGAIPFRFLGAYEEGEVSGAGEEQSTPAEVGLIL